MKRYIRSNRVPKQISVYVSQEYVPGYGWEDVAVYDDTSSESLREAKQDVKDYKDNGYGARVIQRKIDNPDYVEPSNDITYDEAVEWINNCPYVSEEIYMTQGKNYLLSTDPKSFATVQVLVGEDDVVRVRNIRGNRSKQVRSIAELEKEVNRIFNLK